MVLKKQVDQGQRGTTTVQELYLRTKYLFMTTLLAIFLFEIPAWPIESYESELQKAVIEADWLKIVEVGNKWKQEDKNAIIPIWLLGYAGLAKQDYHLATENLSQLGQSQAASKLIKWAEGLVKANPKSAVSMMLKGDALARSGKYDQAIVALDEAVRLAADSALVYNLRGVVKALSDRPVEAEADLEKAISIDPDFADALVSLAIIRLENEDLLGALSYLDNAIAACPDFALAFNTRAVVYGKLKIWEESEGDFEKAVKLAPAVPFLAGNLRLMVWVKGQEQFEKMRSTDSQTTGRGTTLVASSYDRYSVDIGDGRIVDIISIKNTSQTATLAGMEATLNHISDELRNEARLPDDWKPEVLIAQPGLGSSAYAERKNFAKMAFNSGKDFVVCVDTTDRFQWPNTSGDLRMLPIEENVSRRFERAVVAANHVWEKAPDAVLESQATRMLLNGQYGSVTVADLHKNGLLNQDFKLDKVVVVGVPLRSQSVEKQFQTDCIGQLMAITTVSKTGFIASEPIRGVPSVQVQTRLGKPPSHGELFADQWKDKQLNPIPELIGHYNRGVSIQAVQDWTNEFEGSVPMYTSRTTEPISTHLEMASMTRRGLTDPLHDAVLIGCKDPDLGQKIAGQFGGNWRVQIVTETNSTRLQEIAREQGFTRINRIADISSPVVVPEPLSSQPVLTSYTLPEARSLAKGIERFNDTVSLLYTVAEKEMPLGMQLPLEFGGPLIRDIQSAREGRFHPLTSQVFEQIGRFGMSELPKIVQDLQVEKKLSQSFTLPGPLMAGLPDIVAGSASQIGRSGIQPTWQEWDLYISGVNKAAWCALGAVASEGNIETSQAFATAGGLLDDVLSEVSYSGFDYFAHGFVRKNMIQSYETYLRRCSFDKLPAKTFSEMHGQSFVSRVGFNPSHITQLDHKAHLTNTMLTVGQGSSSGQLNPSGFNIDFVPVVVTPTQDEIWKKTPGFFPPDRFSGAGIPTTDYRIPSMVSLGDERGGVSMRADVVKDQPADMSGIFGGETSAQTATQQDHLVCPFLLFCAMPGRSEIK